MKRKVREWLENHYDSDRKTMYGKYDEFIQDTGSTVNKESYNRYVRTIDLEQQLDDSNAEELLEYARKIRDNDIDVEELEDVLKIKAKDIKLGKEIKKLRKENKSLIEEVYDSKAIVDSLSNDLVSHITTIPEPSVDICDLHGDGGTTLINVSDFHYGAVVDPTLIYNVNEYDSNIAKHRIGEYFDTALDFTIKNNNTHIVIFLLGDLINGNIHPENPHDTSATESAIEVHDIIYHNVQKCTKLVGEENVSVYMVVGNHGDIRSGKKPNLTSKAQNNFEYMIGKMLEKTLSCNVQVSDAFFDVAEFEEMRFLIMHGDSIKAGNSLVGFPAFGMARNSSRMQGLLDEVDAEFDCVIMGHFHKYLNIPDNMNRRMIINGSIIGPDEYSVNKLGLAYPPSQVLMCVREGIIYETQEVVL